MTLFIFFLVLCAAVLHASWNAMLRSGVDRLWSMTMMSIAIAVACAVALPFATPPNAASWPYIVGSGFLHVGYNLFLVRAYRTGDLGQTYPIARGSSPLLVTLGAAAFAHEHLTLAHTAGVLLVSGGIMALAFRGRRLTAHSIPAALVTGCFIGAYSVVDGIGVRVAGHVVGYAAWMCLVWGALMPIVYVGLRGARNLRGRLSQVLGAVAGGMFSLVAYGVIIWAMQHAPLGPVSALRETSVVFAALLGRVFLAETLTARRIAACVVIACGAACLGYHA